MQTWPLTCEHAFIDDAGAADQHGVTWHDGPVAGDDHHIAGHQISRHNLFDFCREGRGWRREMCALKKYSEAECSVAQKTMSVEKGEKCVNEPTVADGG